MNKARQKLAQGNKSVLIVSPAGSGKSVVISEIARLTQERGWHDYLGGDTKDDKDTSEKQKSTV